MSKRQEALQVSHLQLKNWKNFANCDVAVANRVFLVGPNASGKSNFLDAFRFLRDLSSAGGGFQEAVRRRSGVSAIRCLAARRYPDIELRAVVQARETSPQWEYELGFNQDAQRRARITKEKVARDGQLLLDRPNEDDKQDAAFLRVARNRVPADPEGLDEPKTTMVNLARSSRRRAIQEDMVPREGSGRQVGPAYSSRLIEFVSSSWRPDVAAGRSDSLRRAIDCLKLLANPP